MSEYFGGSGRSIHVIDIEHLSGVAHPTLSDTAACHEAYRPMIGEQDLVVIAFRRSDFLAVARGWPNARRLVHSDDEGVRQALLDVLTLEKVEERFETVVVASGRGSFTEVVARLGGQGVAVTVVSRPESLSRPLRLAARHVVDVPAVETARPQTEETA